MQDRFTKNQNGSAIMWALLASVTLTGLLLLSIEKAKMVNAAKAKSEAERELEILEQEVMSIFNSPADCNANFLTRELNPTSGTLTALYKNNGSSCTFASGACTAVVERPIYAAGATWSPIGLPGTIKRVRIIGMTYTLKTAQVDGWGSAGSPGIYDVIVVYQKNIAYKNFVTEPKTGQETRHYEFRAVYRIGDLATGIWSDHIGPSASPSIAACAKSANTTTPY